ncbi:oligosaccharide biosynthesis protein Alg14 [Leeuwenhoekiella aestuarii]|uniref:oligosaccharide biosynthesis protein Alg14 n=1 Tax=Leeuwenhoekiella aestuarii TaxID=2249426 RepID=UPI000FFECD82|nr:oligosaccharide biosynthesis protein Alg14 [Leeuwenhoekiella aestuarii]RXG12920.1 oligosaccharide biosynthesis protein Alg14 [Leeuwenhoekiella aestuarii]
MKILAVASAGGHWIQLLRLKPAFTDHQLVYMSTKEEFRMMVPDSQYFVIPDFNRKKKILIFKSLLEIWRSLKSIKPDLVITTGAAPGLACILVGRILGFKTVWLDSIANVEQLSMSGKIATYLSNHVYTQWPELESDKVKYSGKVL